MRASTGRGGTIGGGRRRAMAVAALGGIALLATACGGGSGNNAGKLNTWATAVCTQDVTAAIDDASSALTDMGVVNPGETPQQLRDRLSGDVAKQALADTRLADTLQHAGTPPVSGGAKLRDDTVAELRNSADGWNNAKGQVDALPVDAQNTFADALRALSPSITTGAAASRDALTKLHAGATGKALAAVPGCAAAPAVPAPTDTPSDGGSSQSPAPSGTPADSSSAAASDSQTPAPASS